MQELKIDGKIYMDPVEWGTDNYPNGGLIHVRKDLLDKYQMQAPDTFEQYFAFLTAAKNDGMTGVIFTGAQGIGSAINAFAGAYGAPMLGWVKVNDKWEHWSVQPGIKNALLLFRKMVGDGLVDPASWEDTGDARDKYAAGQGASLLFNGGGHTGRIQNDMTLAGKGAQELLLPALDVGAGSRGYTVEPQFWGGTFITKLEGNKPEDAAKIIDFLNSEDGYRLTAIGIEGRHYEGEGDAIKLLPQRASDGFPMEAGDTGAHPRASGIVSWQPQSWQDFSLLYGKEQSFKDWYAQMWQNQGKYQVKSYGLLTTTPGWTDFQSTSAELISRTFLEIVRAADDQTAAARFDQFVDEWRGAGGAQVEPEMTEVLNKLYS